MKITASFPDGTTVTRETEKHYTHASKLNGIVRFHASHYHATNRVGRRRSDGMIVTTNLAERVPACAACLDERVIEYGPSAVDGSMSVMPCHRCSR